jgi:RNA polymerase sigma-70 factor (ECF subfamily)
LTPDELRRFREGDPELFRELVRRESPRLLHYACHLTRDRRAADELVHDTWVHAFRKRHGYGAGGPLLAWLVAICRSRFQSGLRAESRQSALAARAAQSGDWQAEPAAAQTVEREELRGRLADALAQLPDRQRDVVVCRLVEELSTRETAARLDVAEGTVKATLHQALRALRGHLREHDR